MNIDLSSFAFGSTLDDGTGTPSWGTALGQSSPNYYFTKSGFQNILFGMVYCSVPLKNVSLPLGRGGQVNKCSENETIQLASLFKKVYINGHKIHYPFIMVLQKEDSASHNGRRSIKYTEKAVYEDGYRRIKYSNEEFLDEVKKEFNLTDDACWFVYNIDVKNQDELHFSAYFVNKEEKVSYHDSKQRSAIWTELLTSSNGPFKPFNIKELIESIKSTNLIYSDILIKRFAFSLLTKPFVILSGLAGSGKTQLALALAKSLVEDEKQQLCVVSVGADWTNREPLLGYPNALEAGQYVRPESRVLDMLIECNKDENKDKPFFLILDEMNLSRIEYYFSDFLSLMENEEDKREIRLLNNQIFNTYDKKSHSYLALKDNHTIVIPKNVWFIGTANRDESTFEISDKVYDRAYTMNFDRRAPAVTGYKDPMDHRFLDYATFRKLLYHVPSMNFSVEESPVIMEVEKALAQYNISFGNRILRQMETFINIYCNCFPNPGSKLDEALETILLSKVVHKLEYKNVTNKEELVHLFKKLKLNKCVEFVGRLSEDL